ncbi:hypothetical protein CPB84DRAFT_1966274 [Gymnopilus junonius]|uniref:Uncharacterized protein n=1 Tax=Gymnopilus junonius TaxID=109634 RepID=A0A9P5NDU0_GYMJU|nr:hypothetical protein CPB84DRAFT_1966274 [Gymnopilus junonius]
MDSDTESTFSPDIPDDLDDDFISPLHHDETAYHVYKDLWNNFYDWERDHSKAKLKDLSKPSSRAKDLRTSSAVTSEYFPTHEDVEYFEVEDYDLKTGLVTRYTVAAEPFLLERWDPYARYNSCTSASKSVPANPVNGHLRLSFIPYADDENFDYENYLEDFEDFKWQNDFIDPDLEVIQLETARRLHYTHNFTFSDIDNLGIFKFPMRETSNSGLIWYNAQRDPLPWPAMPPGAIRQLQSGFIKLPAHILRSTWSANPVILPKATQTSQEMKEDGNDPCSNDCYKLKNFDNMILANEDWDENDYECFNSVIQLAPDTLPCDLAVICKKPCYEMFIQRLNVFQDEEIIMEKSQDDGNKKPEFEFLEENEKPMNIELVQPCYHAGPCNRLCPCYKAKQRCQRSCRCSKKCKLRYTGCKCHKKGKKSTTCGDYSCRCRKLLRECDPEACRKCDARHGRCSNTDVQRGKFSNVYIKGSEHGLGAFAAKDIKQGECVGEYIGELHLSLLYDHMAILQKHIHSNYAFDLVGGITVLDSAYLGNETRYLNHSSNHSNCSAEVMLINGEQRIVLTAIRNIKADEELTLNYGSAYWEGKPPED